MIWGLHLEFTVPCLIWICHRRVMIFDEVIALLLLLGGANVADHYDFAQNEFNDHWWWNGFLPSLRNNIREINNKRDWHFSSWWKRRGHDGQSSHVQRWKTDVKITLSVDFITAENLMRMLKVAKLLWPLAYLLVGCTWTVVLRVSRNMLMLWFELSRLFGMDLLEYLDETCLPGETSLLWMWW